MDYEIPFQFKANYSHVERRNDILSPCIKKEILEGSNDSKDYQQG